jgi:hypothetical protein
MNELRFRQVHLDFHTSEQIAEVGADFDTKKFQEALKRGHVNSITLFSKCHHGLSYHPTKVGQMHPHLDFDLMSRQIEACHAIDVKCPIYISAGLDEWAAFHHPEWLAVSREGKSLNPAEAGFKALAFDTAYLDYLCEQITEVVENFDAADGIFLDIIAPRDNFSPLSLARMREQGVDIFDEAAIAQWNYDVLQNYYARTTAASKTGDENRRVFHNSGHILKGAPEIIKWNSHLELESLPTGGWGYDHFPMSAKYATTTGFDFLGMTGKFHTTWGEFGGFKRANALRYECAAMLAFGSKCSIGDQLHPRGEMNLDTYDLIGAAYAEVEEKEAWCWGAKPVSDIALFSPEALIGNNFIGRARYNHDEEGAARMLLEIGAQFDVVDTSRDFSLYKVLILPDNVTLSGEFLNKIEAYRQGGGKLVLSGSSGLNPEKTAFALDLGLELAGVSEFETDYLVPTSKAPTLPVRGPFVVHGNAFNVRASEDFQILATRRDPYFNRTWARFCSHQHTPDAASSEFGGAFSNGEVVYFAHAIFTSYRQLGQPLYRDLLADALKTLLPEPSVETNLPSAGRASLMFQEAENRSILHLLFAVPQKRGADQSGWPAREASVEVIEDLFPLSDVKCLVRTDRPIQSVKVVPSEQTLDFLVEEGAVRFVVPTLLCHAMIELQH